MSDLKILPKSETSLDIISLGEILLRFDPGDERIQHARNFRVWDGGGEYNVAKNLSVVFGQRTSIATALTDNALGRLAENLARAGNVDTSQILWRENAEERTRNGLYFIERGFGLRNPSSNFDRDFTAISKVKPSDFDFEKLFGATKTRWFHTGGIFAGLSDSTFETALEAMQTARKNGAIVSYDLNYRDSLWKHRGGMEKANELNKKLLKHADVVFGLPDFKANFSSLDQSEFQIAAENLRGEFPNLKYVVSTFREIKSANLHNLTAVCFDTQNVYKATDYLNVDVFDRVGSGDAFAAGFIYGLLVEKDAQYAVECGTAHACLIMTTPGDNSTAKLSEVENLMSGQAHRVER